MHCRRPGAHDSKQAANFGGRSAPPTGGRGHPRTDSSSHEHPPYHWSDASRGGASIARRPRRKQLTHAAHCFVVNGRNGPAVPLWRVPLLELLREGRSLHVGTLAARRRPWCDRVVLRGVSDIRSVAIQSGVVDRKELRASLLRHLWEAFSSSIIAKNASVRLYAEKLAVPAGPLLKAGIPLPRHRLHPRSSRRVGVDQGLHSKHRGRRLWSPGQRIGVRLPTPLRRAIRREAGRNGRHARWRRPSRRSLRGPRWRSSCGRDKPRRLAGLELDPSVAERSSAEHPEHLTSDSVANSVGRWHRDLTSDDAEYVWTVLGSKLVAHGYSE